MNDRTPGRGKRFIALVLALFLIFMAALLACGWRLMRPVGGAYITAAESGTALAARGNLPAFEPGEGALPGPLAALARLHVYKTKWFLIDSKGARRSVKLSATPFSAMTPAPVVVGSDSILYAAADDRVAVAGLDGKTRDSYRMPGQTVRVLSACGGRAVWTTIGRAGMRTVFRLYTADANLTRAAMADTDALFPMLGPGTLGCGTDGTVYFTGHNPEDHARRVTYGVGPGMKQAVPVTLESDWGALFALSPDDMAAASAGSRGITITRTAIGRTTAVKSVPPSDPAKPAWSHDGRYIALLHQPARNQRISDNIKTAPGAAAHVMIVDAKNMKVIARSDAVKNFSCGPCAPVWSPDGGRVFINGVRSEKRAAGMLVTRYAVLCFDIKTRKLLFPNDPVRLWK